MDDGFHIWAFLGLIALSFTLGGIITKGCEREKWCEHTYQSHKDVKACEDKPPYMKGE